MSLQLTKSITALAINLTASCLAVGGTPPYVYSVRSNGAGGSIDSVSGLYTAPPVVNPDPAKAYDVIQVEDSLGAKALGRILVGTPLVLFCEILQKQMGLADGRVFLWDQKIFQPSDDDLYVVVSNPLNRPFGNSNSYDGSGAGLNSIQSVSMQGLIGIDIISRGPAARDRKEEIILALNSDYAQSQQEINSFYIGKLPPNSQFINLSAIDGAAIPYRYRISINMQYAVTKTTAVPYFDTFEDVSVVTDA